ncbi:hypothetical protein [Rahnella sikkimica]|uniref:Transcriptional regulator TetR C-terminal Proteobacteria type domain-containing protein n=1 Tax=Rahnella sikkimica TaxID=1805933 RepID=A0A2L1UXA3_9GAMM|nr:hypothetical protein [Rahnella sikkimica]AVF37555.1 hypothetical protein BV494_21725 [Rahnella sikkimica]
MPESNNAVFRDRLTVLARSLRMAPQVAENQVLDRMALSFRKLLNFFAEDEVLTQRVFLLPPEGTETQAMLIRLVAENITFSQQDKLFRDDIPAALLAQCFTGMLVQLAHQPAEPAQRHQDSLACAKLFCEGIWVRE